ncbi:MAG: hypothetical protein AAF270_03945 [Pseudomonadota bacterium]
MWVSKPVYEAVPYIYLIAGAALMGLSLYLDFGYWPTICLLLGVASLVAGLVIWLRRRDYRDRQSHLDDTLL